MFLEEARTEIVQTCLRLARDGLLPGTSGNVSVRVGDVVAVTPSGVDYTELTPGAVGVHQLDGTPVEAPLLPTSELPLHLAVYAATGAAAVVHTHSTAATAVSTLVEAVPPIHYLVALFGPTVPVVPYARYGTDELAYATAAALRDSTGCLLANHGAVTIGPDLAAAETGCRYLEWISDVYLRATAAGTPRFLPEEEIRRVGEKINSTYGQRRPVH